MNKIIHHAEDRGKGDYGWLSTRYSFSFANWYNPARLGFGALLVINDDTIAPGTGFGTHAHRDMEIITVVTSGTLTHKDSMGNVGTISAGEIQVMSAGTGVEHSEYNASETEPLTLFQIWILPNAEGVPPRYEQKMFESSVDGVTELVGPLGDTPGLGIHQDAYITRIRLEAGAEQEYVLTDPAHGVYAFVVAGSADVEGVLLAERDALGLSDASHIRITAQTTLDLLLIEVPV